MELMPYDKYSDTQESYRVTLSFLAQTIQEGRGAIIDGADTIIADIQNMVRLLDNPKDDYEIEAVAHVARAIEPMQRKIELFVHESVDDFNIFLGHYPGRFYIQKEQANICMPLEELVVVGEAGASDIAMRHSDEVHVFSEGGYKLLINSSTID